jgi:hypothetical protein
MQLIAGFSVYLILVFVLPGFAYLLAFAITFPEEFAALPKWLPRPAEGDKDLSFGFWLAVLAIVGGLLLSSVCFAIEIGLRKFDSFLPIFLASPIMHFNVGVGLSIILIIYVWYGRRNVRIRWAMALAIVVVANLFVAHELAVRVNEMVDKRHQAAATGNKPAAPAGPAQNGTR